MTELPNPLLDRLTRFDPDPPRSGVTPSDVRRRGDRLRRRRTAATLITAVVVALAVLTPVAVLGGRDNPSRPAPAAPTAPTAPTPSESPNPAPDEPGRGDVPGIGDIPARFPLAAGLPTRAEPGQPGLQGPGPDVDGVPLEVCGEPRPAAGAAGAVGSLRATFTDVVDYRERQLVTFETADAAVAWVDAVRAQAEACPTDREGDRPVVLREVRELALGGQSYAVVARTAGMAQLVVTQVVRLGRGVLVDLDASEAGAGPDPEADLQEVVDRMSVASGPVVSAMCVFTADGCGPR